MVLLVRYGELALKSRFVRRQLEDRLATNVREMFAANDVECVLKVERGRLFVHAEDEADALRLLRRVFGIVSISATKETASALETLTAHVVAYARNVLEPGKSFAIRPRRTGEQSYTSQDLARVLGKAVQDAIPGVVVDLDDPDREIHVEVRGGRAYVFHEIVPGPGGLPLGSQGEVLAAVGDEAGMVATWLLMRRGCRARVAGTEPYVATLRKWDPRLEVGPLRAADELLGRVSHSGTFAIVSSEALEQNPLVSGDASLRLRPLLGLSDVEMHALSERIRDA